MTMRHRHGVDNPVADMLSRTGAGAITSTSSFPR